jgi:hypothetical protein
MKHRKKTREQLGSGAEVAAAAEMFQEKRAPKAKSAAAIGLQLSFAKFPQRSGT